MRPGLAIYDVSYCATVDSEFFSETLAPFALLVSLKNFKGLIFGQLGARMLFASNDGFRVNPGNVARALCLPAFFVAVSIIFGACPKFQMSRVDADRYVAFVHYTQAVWNWSFSKDIGEAMGIPHHGIDLKSAVPMKIVTTSAPEAYPYPASGSSRKNNLVQKTTFVRIGDNHDWLLSHKEQFWPEPDERRQRLPGSFYCSA